MLDSSSSTRTVRREPLSILVLALFACALVSCALVPRAVQADEGLDTAHACSLAVQAAYDKEPLTGLEFSVRRVASVDASGRYLLADSYSMSGVELNGLGAAQDWDAAASQLEAWTGSHGIEVQATAATGADGIAHFDALEPGIYLLTSTPLKVDARTYTAKTYLVAVPGANDDGSWNYDVSSICKISMTETGQNGKDDQGADADRTKKSEGAKAQSWAERLGLVATGDGRLTLFGTVLFVGLGAVLVGAALMVRSKVRE